MKAALARRLTLSNRLSSAGCVCVYLLATQHLWPDPTQRGAWHFVLVLVFGYGHLLGSAVSVRSGRPRSSMTPRTSARTATLILGVSFIPIAYATLIDWLPAVTLALLAVSIWHTVENDAVFGRWYADDFRPPPLGDDPRHHLRIAGATLLVVAFGTACLARVPIPSLGIGIPVPQAAFGLRCATLCVAAFLAGPPGGRDRRSALALLALALGMPWRPEHHLDIRYADFFAIATLYHLFSWSIALFHRLRLGGAHPGLARRVALCHGIPAAIALAAHAAPPPVRSDLIGTLFSPSLYLYYSMLHVVQTVWTRSLRRR
jgi:hypothetical protein